MKSSKMGLGTKQFLSFYHMRLEEAFAHLKELKENSKAQIAPRAEVFSDPTDDEFAPVRNALKECDKFHWMPPAMLLDVSTVTLQRCLTPLLQRSLFVTHVSLVLRLATCSSRRRSQRARSST